MTEKKQPPINNSRKEKLALKKAKPTTARKPAKKAPALPTTSPLDVWQAFDDTFSKFRAGFEDLFFPPNWAKTFDIVPKIRVPVIDLKDEDSQFVLTAEMPGFKKEDIEIEVQDNSISITGTAGWKYDEKGHLYICKERACKTFYRKIELPEEVKVDEVKGDLSQGVLEITLPKKAPKQKRKIQLK